MSDVAGLAAARKDRAVRVVDARRNDERAVPAGEVVLINDIYLNAGIAGLDQPA